MHSVSSENLQLPEIHLDQVASDTMGSVRVDSNPTGVVCSAREQSLQAVVTDELHLRNTLAEWLRRRPAEQLGYARVGSNPTGVACLGEAFAWHAARCCKQFSAVYSSRSIGVSSLLSAGLRDAFASALFQQVRGMPSQLAGRSRVFPFASRPFHFLQALPAGLEPAFFGLEVRRLVH